MGKDCDGQQRVGKPLKQPERNAPRPVQQHLQGRHVPAGAHQRAIETQAEQIQGKADGEVESRHATGGSSNNP
ncbi:hypothetical protein D3C73_1491070 [compost metagenome]